MVFKYFCCLVRRSQKWTHITVWIEIIISVSSPVSVESSSYWTVLTVSLQQVRHEGDVDDGQTERVDAGQPLLVGERGNFPPQFIKRLVQAKHPLPFPHVGRLPLDHGDDPPPFGLAGMPVRPAAVAPRRAHHQTLVLQVLAPGRVVQRTG